MRKGELAGLRWSDLDQATGRVKIERQLVKAGPAPVRALEEQDAAHRGHQAEIKPRNGVMQRRLGHKKIAITLSIYAMRSRACSRTRRRSWR